LFVLVLSRRELNALLFGIRFEDEISLVEFQHGIRAAQKTLIRSVAYEGMDPLSLSLCLSYESFIVKDCPEKDVRE
jgi:hypothetical protein